jgi:SAM-dependent methyltransferase
MSAEETPIDYSENLRDWDPYYGRTENGKVWGPLDRVVDLVKARHLELTAGDYGAGAGRGSRYLLEQGFQRVVAVEPADEAQRYLQRLLPLGNLEIVHTTLEDYLRTAEPNQFGLVNAGLVFPFIDPRLLPEVIEGTLRTLKSGGLVSADLFGPKNVLPSRAGSRHLTSSVANKDAAAALFRGWKNVDITEIDRPGENTHIHNFSLIAERP